MLCDGSAGCHHGLFSAAGLHRSDRVTQIRDQDAPAALTLFGMLGLGADLAEDSVRGDPAFGGAPRVAVVFERSDAGAAALREAAELANAGHELSVVTLAPQARVPPCGRAGGTGPYNLAIRQEAQLELREARALLGSVAGRATFNVLAGCPQPPLASWVAQHRVVLVLLPRRRLTLGGNVFARSLRKQTSAEVRLVR